ncbi:MAG: hypothetical protein U1F48_13735 [Burkholderiales bacterium]
MKPYMEHDMDLPNASASIPPSKPAELIQRIRSSLGDCLPAERGHEKRDAALRWLFLFHKSTPGLIRQVVGVQAAGYAAQLGRRNLTKTYLTDSVRGARVVMLTDLGLSVAEGMFPEHIGTYDTRWTSVRQQFLVHDLMAQKELLHVMDKHPVHRFLPERLAGRGDRSAGKRPDIQIWFPDGHLPFNLEIERTSKNIGYELDRALYASARAVHRNEVAGVIYVFINDPVAELYKRTLTAPLPLWKKDEASAKWALTGKSWQVPAEIQERFQWIVRPELLHHFMV